TGYFWAYYYRSSNSSESFQYNPDPAVENTVNVKLRERTDDEYTGDLDSDFRLAALKGDLLKLKDLVHRGSNVESRDLEGDTALIQASTPDVARFLIAQGVDVDERNNYGVTALMKSADSGRLGIVLELLNGRADLNLKDKYGYTALMY